MCGYANAVGIDRAIELVVMNVDQIDIKRSGYLLQCLVCDSQSMVPYIRYPDLLVRFGFSILQEPTRIGLMMPYFFPSFPPHSFISALLPQPC